MLSPCSRVVRPTGLGFDMGLRIVHGEQAVLKLAGILP